MNQQRLDYLDRHGYRIIDTHAVEEGKSLYELRYNHLKIDTCRTSNPDTATQEFFQKASSGSYDFKISHPILVSVAMVRLGRQYAMGRRTNVEEVDLFGFPGGKVGAGENVLEAAVRELYEETQLKAIHVRHVGFIDSFIHRHFHCHVFLITDHTGVLTNTEPTKCKGWELYTADQIPSLPLAPTARQIHDLGILDLCESF